jgi:dynein intermediate chain 2
MWWDTRKLEDGPTEILNITDNIAGEKEEIVGGTSLEFNVEAGPGKLLIGTESGTIMTTNKRLRKPVEITTRYGLE